MLRSAATIALRRAQRPTTGPSIALRVLSTSSDAPHQLSYSKIPKDDFGQYTEYSVIFTNRALNLMSDPFQRVMRDLNNLLKTTYNADKVAIIPG
jgi:alanine-glyoxylate transaminase / serine-glyoxylate transaminase / serine-pyruvate transaminase